MIEWVRSSREYLSRRLHTDITSYTYYLPLVQTVCLVLSLSSATATCPPNVVRRHPHLSYGGRTFAGLRWQRSDDQLLHIRRPLLLGTAIPFPYTTTYHHHEIVTKTHSCHELQSQDYCCKQQQQLHQHVDYNLVLGIRRTVL